MKILMVLTSRFPPDSRVEKEAVSLSEAGHDVHILCYANRQEPHYEEVKHYSIHRFTASAFFRNKLSAVALIWPRYFSVWRRQMERLNDHYHFDAFHIHDLPLSNVGYYFKKRFGSRLICDQHEFYSDWIRKAAHMNTLVGRIVSRLSNWRRYEKRYLKRADLVITVATPLEENYRKSYQLKGDRIITVPNTPAKNVYNSTNVKKEIVDKYKDDFILFYAGGIDILRGIDTAIIALAEIRKEIPHARLLLCGKIVKPYDPFKTAEKHGVADLLTFEGWIPEEELPSYIAASEVCFFTPPENRDEINKTIATKIYQYAMMGKPVIVSRAKMMKEFVEENHLGVSIDSGDAGAFADAVLKIFHREVVTKPLAQKNLFWEDTVQPLIYGYNKLK